MFGQEALNIFGNSSISTAVGVVVIMVLLYVARLPAHRAILSISRVLHNGLRLMSRSLLMAERGLVNRNREVLLSTGAETVELEVEREFQRVDAAVRRDVSEFPSLQQKLAEQFTLLEEDYTESAAIPPPPPGWVHAVEAVATLSASGQTDAPVRSILEEIHKSTGSQFKSTMTEYRKTVQERHVLLNRMRPYWRAMTLSLEEMNRKIASLKDRTQIIDNHMERYEQIRTNTDQAQRILSTSSLTQFFIAALVLAIAIGGAIINFNLIALPMSEMVGGGSYIGDYKTSDVAALVIILVEVAMGLYLMESLRITRLFPVIGQMDDKMRKKMVWITFGILFILASVESSLALMRDQIAADMQALRQSLANVETGPATTSIIPTAGQMLMGFILPFALTFVAIPLETFVNSARGVLGGGLALLLRVLAFILRLLGNVAQYMGTLLVNIYDLIVCLPLWAERRFKSQETAFGAGGGNPASSRRQPAKLKAAPGPKSPSNAPMEEEEVAL